ncbi:MAG TPA: FtsX-like permease family protein [Marmoricola sp.]
MSGARWVTLATMLRGLRARATLSAGSVLLTALAIGSAVLGPSFSSAVTSSYLLTRLDEAPVRTTGLTFTFSPAPGLPGGPAAVERVARQVVAAHVSGAFARGSVQLESARIAVGDMQLMLLARAGACHHLVVTGRCPARAGEALVLAGDEQDHGLRVGRRLSLGAAGVVRIVGTYRLPRHPEGFWFDPGRLVSIPAINSITTGHLPARPAPLLTPAATFTRLPVTDREVRVDRPLAVGADLTVPRLDAAVASARAVHGRTYATTEGVLAAGELNDLPAIARDVRAQQRIAQRSIAPAVLCLVLVALALLLRLLSAAAELRVPELALASLRGTNARRRWLLGMAEPVLLVGLAVPLGAVVGVGLTALLTRWWLAPGLAVPLPWSAVVGGVLMVLAALVVAALAVGAVLRVSLSDQLTGVRRPHAARRAAVLAQLALLAVAVAVLAGKLAGGHRGSPDLADLVLPVLLAVLAGLGATRFAALVAGWWTRRSRGRGLAVLVAVRAIARRREGTLVILPITAAVAIGVFATGVYSAAAHWRASVAATEAPAASVWRSPLPLSQTVALTHRLDPRGRWLMGAGTVGYSSGLYAVLDTPRLARVTGWPDLWTPGTSAADIVREVGPHAQAPRLTGSRIAVTLDNAAGADRLTLELHLVTPTAQRTSAYVGPFGRGVSTRRVSAPYCHDGCRLEGFALGGAVAAPTRMHGSITLRQISADGRPARLDGADWVDAPGGDQQQARVSPRVDGGRLELAVDTGAHEQQVAVGAAGVPERRPVVVGTEALGPLRRAETRSVPGASVGGDVPVRPVQLSRSVPFLGPSGILIDYTMLFSDRQVYEQLFHSYVLADAATPSRVRDALSARGLSLQTTRASVQRLLDNGAYALALRLYAVAAVLVLVMALAGLLVSTAVQLPERRRDAAALRVVGVPRRTVLGAVATELLVVLVSAALAGVAAGALAEYVVLRTVTLGTVEEITTPALVTSVEWPWLLAVAGGTVGVLLVVAVASGALAVRGARGSTLRESAR